MTRPASAPVSLRGQFAQEVTSLSERFFGRIPDGWSSTLHQLAAMARGEGVVVNSYARPSTISDEAYARRLASTIHNLRMGLGLYQYQAGERAGLAQSEWARVESGRGLPTIPTLRKCARALDTTLPELLAQVEA